MKVLTYTSYKEHCGLYTKIHGSIAVNSCQIELLQKDMILLSRVSIIVFKTGKQTGVENTKFEHFISQLVLIQLTILVTRSRKQSCNKDKTVNHPRLKT